MTPPSRTLRSLSLASVLTHSDNRRICGSATLRSNLLSQTSHIPGTLYAIVKINVAKSNKGRRK